MDPISIEKIRAMSKCSNCKRQQMLLPTLAICMVVTSVLFLLVTSPVWLPRLCSLMAFFFLTTLPDLAMAFLLSPKCLFVVGNLIVAFLVGESRLAPRGEPASLVNDIHEEHVKRNAATSAKAATAVLAIDHNALVGELGQEEEEEEEEGEEEELHQRVEDFIARVKKQRRLEDKSIYDTDR
ncbi:hypothetical protein E2562_016707 [Oryza meyeriana var. granulata]|uniref:DUF4408 domain-containing protein n=1 Tax=Oryza meyeriana var. granulata TaxID=110450 RepID=A0A6G1EL19_9ORYZ|nr:hypothetical protein E2562_016707 [Oryza meyeriana var. granulata]